MNPSHTWKQKFNQNPDRFDDTPTNTSSTDTIGDLIARRYSRRTFVQGSLAATVSASLIPLWGCSEKENIRGSKGHAIQKEILKPNFNFKEISHGHGPEHLVASDHEAQVLLRWGDPIFPDAPKFDPYSQSAESQKQQFGFNNDFIGYRSLKPLKGQQERALLCVNHEYPSPKMMFTGMTEAYWEKETQKHIDIEMASVGCTIVEIYKSEGNWAVNLASPYNRRITASSTEFEITGPVAGHERLKTSADQTGTRVIGTMNNCAGGMTPWGTYLSCEENINSHFMGELAEGHPENRNHKRYGVPSSYLLWGKYYSRFNLGQEPNEPNRFGWVVEIDPMDPNSTPKKRTALGRLKHEGAENVIAPNGQLVVYMGDDQRFDYLYKFVSRDKVDLENTKANKDLLDYGTLYVARFSDQGDVHWKALVFGSGPLTEGNDFHSQADVLIETRRAADLLKATPLDRPEDVVPNKATGKVYVMLTNNTKRKPDQLSATSPRGPNTYGHIIEISEPDGDFTSELSSWDFLIKAGDPSKPEVEAQWHSATSQNGWFASPDNGVIDPDGRLWVSSDQGDKVSLSGTNDGLWAIETQGELRGKGAMFFRCPDGAELCGPVFSDNGNNLFVAVQHPGEKSDEKGEAIASFDHPSTRWPDFKAGMPPRPSVVVVQRKAGGKVG